MTTARACWTPPVVALSASLLLAATGCGGAPKAPLALPSAGGEVATWPTWVLSAPDQIAVAPPPRRGSSAEKTDTAEFNRLARNPGRRATEIVRRWDQTSATEPWTKLNVAVVSATTIEPPLAARGYALTSVAMYDAVVSAGYWKRRYRRAAPRIRGATLQHAAVDSGYPSDR
ncbi:MAG: hypothetical protein QOJ29_388, partial [Thermoleophilaceae bacterium]|nr:hypothetical protein [Thermoleophilaceae bacterium]